MSRGINLIDYIRTLVAANQVPRAIHRPTQLSPDDSKEEVPERDYKDTPPPQFIAAPVPINRAATPEGEEKESLPDSQYRGEPTRIRIYNANRVEVIHDLTELPVTMAQGGIKRSKSDSALLHDRSTLPHSTSPVYSDSDESSCYTTDSDSESEDELEELLDDRSNSARAPHRSDFDTSSTHSNETPVDRDFSRGRRIITIITAGTAGAVATFFTGGIAAPLAAVMTGAVAGYSTSAISPELTTKTGRLLSRSKSRQSLAFYNEEEGQLLVTPTLPITTTRSPRIEVAVENQESISVTPTRTSPSVPGSPTFIRGRRIITSGSVFTGLGIALFFTGGIAILPATVIVAASGAVGYGTSNLIPNVSRRLGRRFGTLIGVGVIEQNKVYETEEDIAQHRETGNQTIGTIAGVGALGAMAMTGWGIPMAIVAAAGVAKVTTVITKRRLPNSAVISTIGRWVDDKRQVSAQANKFKVRQTTWPRPGTMVEAHERRAMQEEGKGIIAVGVATTVGILALFSSGGMMLVPLAAAASYIAADTVVGSFLTATTISNQLPAINEKGDTIAKIGRAMQELKGAGWSIPSLIASRAFNDRFAKGALEAFSAVNIAAAIADTATAIKLMKKIPPEKVEQAIKFVRVRHKFYRSIAWGVLLDIGLCILINYLIPPMGLAHLKIKSYYLLAVIFGGLGATTTLSYCGIRHLDRVTAYCLSKFVRCRKKRKAKNPDILIEDDDVLLIDINLLKGSGTHTLRQIYRNAEFVGPRDNCALLIKANFLKQRIIDDFNATIKRNWESIPEARRPKKLLQIESKDGKIIINHITQFSLRDGQVVKIKDGGREKAVVDSAVAKKIADGTVQNINYNPYAGSDPDQGPEAKPHQSIPPRGNPDIYRHRPKHNRENFSRSAILSCHPLGEAKEDRGSWQERHSPSSSLGLGELGEGKSSSPSFH